MKTISKKVIIATINEMLDSGLISGCKREEEMWVWEKMLDDSWAAIICLTTEKTYKSTHIIDIDKKYYTEFPFREGIFVMMGHIKRIIDFCSIEQIAYIPLTKENVMHFVGKKVNFEYGNKNGIDTITGVDYSKRFPLTTKEESDLKDAFVDDHGLQRTDERSYVASDKNTCFSISDSYREVMIKEI